MDELAAPECGPEARRQSIDRLKRQICEVLILGGGINGAGIARDLALRARETGQPLGVALIERRQFGSGTSSRNSQLIHGGLRYLKSLEFRLVREALRERATLVTLAPHLVEPLPFLLPVYSRFARLQYGVGLWLYDLLAGERNLGRRGWMPAEDAAGLEPDLAREGLVALATFYDGRVNSARFLLANVLDAARNGAIVANHLAAESWVRGAAAWDVSLLDTLTGERFTARARKLVDTTGPWSSPGSLRLVRGSHIVVPRLNASGRAIAHFEAGRILFVIPWGERGDRSLVGTTDVDHDGGPDAVRASTAEIAYLEGMAQRLFPRSAGARPVSAFSSLRPLLRSATRSATRTSREHRIWNSPDGILHVAGGKYTTYRAMSEEAADMIAREVAPKLAGARVTALAPLLGNSAERLADLRARTGEFARRHALDEAESARAIALYGVHAPAVFALLPDRAPAGLSRLDVARIAFAVRHEMAGRLSDLLFISTYWGYEQEWKRDHWAPHAAEMGRLLGWDSSRVQREIEDTECLAALPRS